jgi:carboxyl-terminal processing protease
MAFRRSWASLVLATAALGCTARQSGATRPPPFGATPAEEIRRVAAVIEREHVVPVDAGGLVRAAARAIEAEAVTPAPPGAGAGGEAAAVDLDPALARLRAARPEATDSWIIALAVKAMVASLGDRSRYVEAEEVRRNWRLPGSTPEVRGAVGIVVKKHDLYLLLDRVLPATPAAAAGVEAGLELRAVDGRATTGLSLDDVVRLLVGPVGSEAKLALGRPGEAERVVVVRRAEVDAGAVDCRILGGRVLYLGVRQLGGRTVGHARGFAGATGEPARLVVLDLRGNQGGLLDAAWELADTFLASDPILTVQEREPKPRRTHHAAPGTSPLEGARVAVLVDGETASGAEAVAAALQDNSRGVVIGSRTAAAASIDILFEVGGGGVLRLTVGHLLRASGEPIEARGISPNLTLDAPGPAPGPPLSDAACPGLASPAPVAGDPAVARAAAYLLAP